MYILYTYRLCTYTSLSLSLYIYIYIYIIERCLFDDICVNALRLLMLFRRRLEVPAGLALHTGEEVLVLVYLHVCDWCVIVDYLYMLLVCVYIYIYMYIHIYIYICIHICIYTQIVYVFVVLVYVYALSLGCPCRRAPGTSRSRPCLERIAINSSIVIAIV